MYENEIISCVIPLLMNRAQQDNMKRWYGPASTLDSVCPGLEGVFREAHATRPANIDVQSAPLESVNRRANISQPDRKRMRVTIDEPDDAANIEFQDARVKSLTQEAYKAMQDLATIVNVLNDAINVRDRMQHAQT